MTTDTPSLDRLFRPQTIAVVGASAAPEKPGFQIMKAFDGFPGDVIPVNPRGGEILGRSAAPSLREVEGIVDMVALLVPPAASADVLREAAEIGAGSAFMISGGFGETGEDGEKLQSEIADICREAGIRLLGPNTSGFIRPAGPVIATFLPTAKEFRPGNIGIVAQSGGINITLAFLTHLDGLGMSLACGLGNGADVRVADVIDYLADDPDTEVIVVHLEGVPDGRRLYESVERAAALKPVVALAVGRNDLGGFAESHTGNLMGRFELTRAALVQAGGVVVDTTMQAVDCAAAFARGRMTPTPNPGVGLLTGQAGPGILITDMLKSDGVDLPALSDASVETISGLLPPMTYITNPVDTGRPSPTFGAVADALAADDAIDLVAAWALLEDELADFGAVVTEARNTSGKPVLFGTAAPHDDLATVRQALSDVGIASYPTPDRLATAVIGLAEDARHRARRQARTASASILLPELPDGNLDEDQAKSVIEALGIATPRRFACGSHDEAHEALREIGRPVVAKVLDAELAHKTEVGGVRIGIENSHQLRDALEHFDGIGGGKRRYLIEEMAPAGLELILGATNDPAWGPTVLVGLGGTAAEAIGDVALRLAPLTPADADEMLGELRGKALLDGWRGAPPVDRTALVAAIVALGELVAGTPGIRELDLNPVRAYPKGLLALDAVILKTA